MASELQDEIRELIAPWKEPVEQPPFSVDELVVIALSLNPESIQAEIELYFQDLALTSVCQLSPWPDSADSFFKLQRRFTEVFYKLEVPIYQCVQLQPSESRDQRWTVTPEGARQFLQCRLRHEVPDHYKPFPLLKLPAELRTKVYESALQYPRFGIFIDRKTRMEDDRERRAYIRTIGQRDQALHESSKSELEALLYARSRPLPGSQVGPAMKVSLALLQVNKQIFKEAMPVFYSINNFAFPNIERLGQFLEATPTSRREHIGHVSFRHNPEVIGRKLYCSWARENYISVCKLLQSIEYLRELDITISEDDWLQVRTPRVTQKYKNVTQIPGVNDLRALRGLKDVRFHGDCDTFKTFVDEMLKEKPAPEVPIVSRKRKVGVDEEGEGEGAEVASTNKKSRAKKKTQ